MHELFITPKAQEHSAALVQRAHELDVPISLITNRAADGLSETVTPQGIVAVCDLLDRPLETVFGETANLVVVLADVSDPGNAGTVIRVADAAGVNAVILAGDSVDPHNGKCVRAAAGSLFHVPIARVRDIGTALAACSNAGLRTLAAHGYAEEQLDSIELSLPTAWVFGNEAHGLRPEVLDAADTAVRIPIYGEAESLNLATAAAVCVYASAMSAHRQ
jgi:TrmH family RNA methyltransferase